jgi:hypothetical protein
MDTNLIALPDLTWTVVAASIVLSPIICGLMAYRVSRAHTMRNAD